MAGGGYDVRGFIVPRLCEHVSLINGSGREELSPRPPCSTKNLDCNGGRDEFLNIFHWWIIANFTKSNHVPTRLIPQHKQIEFLLSILRAKRATFFQPKIKVISKDINMQSLRSYISKNPYNKSILFISVERRWKSCRVPSLYLEQNSEERREAKQRKSFPPTTFFWSNSSCSRVVVFSLLWENIWLSFRAEKKASLSFFCYPLCCCYFPHCWRWCWRIAPLSADEQGVLSKPTLKNQSCHIKCLRPLDGAAQNFLYQVFC